MSVVALVTAFLALLAASVPLLGTMAGAETAGVTSQTTTVASTGSPATNFTYSASPIATIPALTDGQDISIAVNAAAGTSIFGVEARECAGDANVNNLSDYSPFQSGECVLTALGTGDLHSSVATAPPNQTAALDFHVGVGTETFTEQDGVTQSTITCDSTHPCQLILREQTSSASSPDNFIHYNLTFAGPVGPPDSPTAPAAVAGNQSANVTWTAPVNTGNSPLSNYRITPFIAGVAQIPILTGGTATHFNVTGLTNNTAYTFAVAAENAANIFSLDSAQTAAVTPTSPPPTGVSAAPGNTSATVSWTAPALAGVDDYRVTPFIAGVAQAPVLTGSTATSFNVTGLTNGTAYTFGVAAHYATGFTNESAQSASVTPSAAGVAQQITVAIPAGTLTITEAGTTVDLGTATLDSTAKFWQASGDINEVTVTDTRFSEPGWTASGQVTDFSSGSNTFPGSDLGWVPAVDTTSPGQVVTAGPAITVAPATPVVGNLATGGTLASAAPGATSLGAASLKAALDLSTPTSTAPGVYTATLTLTAI